MTSFMPPRQVSWQESQLAHIPSQWRRKVERIHAKKLAAMDDVPAGRGLKAEIERAANEWLREIVAKVDRVKVPINLSDADLIELAERQARECMDLAGASWLKTPEAIRERLARHVAVYGIPCPADRTEHGPAIARMTDSLWWRRGLRKAQARDIEAAAIDLGYVRKGSEIYASQATVDRRQQQRKRNASALAATSMVNLDTGDEYTLEELAARSVANPEIRRGELMTRIAGFEAEATRLNHVAEFWTVTCPSRMHKWREVGPENSRRFEENPRYDGTTPREAQQWLSQAWARFRSAIDRHGLPLYGFRISEPHHDGTPHWHLLIFSPAWMDTNRRAIPRLRALFRRYFLDFDSKPPTIKETAAAAEYQRLYDELRARKMPKYQAAEIVRERATCEVHHAKIERRRTERADKARRQHGFEFIAIDPKRGSAAGYVAKYVSKNINGGGYHVQGDIEGDDAIVPANRVEAWASTWGIRQFQQIGGPPVGVWRELRRLPADGEYSATVAAARSAADCGTKNGHDENGAAGNWRRYVEIMDGPILARANRPLMLAKTANGERYNYATAEIERGRFNRYDEPSAKAVWGIHDAQEEKTFPSVRYRWELKHQLKESFEISGPDFSAPRTCVNNCTGLVPDNASIEYLWPQQKPLIYDEIAELRSTKNIFEQAGWNWVPEAFGGREVSSNQMGK